MTGRSLVKTRYSQYITEQPRHVCNYSWLVVSQMHIWVSRRPQISRMTTNSIFTWDFRYHTRKRTKIYSKQLSQLDNIYRVIYIWLCTWLDMELNCSRFPMWLSLVQTIGGRLDYCELISVCCTELFVALLIARLGWPPTVCQAHTEDTPVPSCMVLLAANLGILILIMTFMVSPVSYQ